MCWESVAAIRCWAATICDPDGHRGAARHHRGGWACLISRPEMHPTSNFRKSLQRHAASGLSVEGYEIHIGRSDGPDRAATLRPCERSRRGRNLSTCGRVSGTYLHGLFVADAFRAAYLGAIGITVSGESHQGAGRGGARTRWPIIWRRIWMSRRCWVWRANQDKARARRAHSAAVPGNPSRIQWGE